MKISVYIFIRFICNESFELYCKNNLNNTYGMSGGIPLIFNINAFLCDRIVKIETLL